MTTWNVITITGAQQLTERKLSKAVERAGLTLDDEQIFAENPGCWKVCGNSKYEAEGICDLAADLTRRHPGARAYVFQDWDTRHADEAGQSLDIYRNGERKDEHSQVTGLVPVDLRQSIDAVRAALGGSGDLATAAAWLIDGLDGGR